MPYITRAAHVNSLINLLSRVTTQGVGLLSNQLVSPSRPQLLASPKTLQRIYKQMLFRQTDHILTTIYLVTFSLEITLKIPKVRNLQSEGEITEQVLLACSVRLLASAFQQCRQDGECSFMLL